MNPILRNVLVVLAAVVVGSMVNMAIITVGPSLISPPVGVDVSDVESFSKNIHLFEPKHFLMPFLAHALGTLVGAFLVAKFVLSKQKNFAIGIAAWFMLGGIAAAIMLKAPLWFTAIDLSLAYIPMGILGWKLAGAKDYRNSTILDDIVEA